jgi:hypothetical protein
VSALHTPGPLKASKGWDDDSERWVVVADGPRQYHVATIENGQPGDTCETEGHTARLFAAAPDLLAACQAFIELANDCDMRPEDETHELYGVIRRAISKATEASA